MLTTDKIIEIFVKVDDFCKEFETEIAQHHLDAGDFKTSNRKASLADSEIITILIAFHSGYFTNLKHFYLGYIRLHCKDYFPGLVSYNRFVELQQRVDQAELGLLIVEKKRENFSIPPPSAQRYIPFESVFRRFKGSRGDEGLYFEDEKYAIAVSERLIS